MFLVMVLNVNTKKLLINMLKIWLENSNKSKTAFLVSGKKVNSNKWEILTYNSLKCFSFHLSWNRF